MNQARPLLFLTYRSFVNGLKRALTSPRRLITLIFFSGYYFMIFIRPALMPRRMGPMPSNLVGTVQFPAFEVIDALAFGLFSVLSFMLLMGVLSYQGGFKPADVDILFPTPISPKAVLLFRMCRDYVATLILPFFIVILGLQPVKMGWEAIFRGMPNPEYSGLAVRFMTLSWLLMSLSWIGVSYAISLYTTRSDLNSDRNRKVLIIGICIVATAIAGYIIFELRNAENLQDVLQLARSPFLRTVFFTATFATELTLAPFQGSILMGVSGAAGLLGIIVASLFLAFKQSGWLYDQAAVRGFKSSKSRDLQRAGDIMGVIAERARAGKFKVRKTSWVHKLRFQGVKALIWKELLLQPRSMLGLLVIFSIVGVVQSSIPAIISRESSSDMPLGYLLLVMQGTTLLMITLSIAQVGFIELLRRVDLQKPMPFSPSMTALVEVLSKSILGIVVCLLGAIVAVCLNFTLWPFALACMVLSPVMSIQLSSMVLLVTLMFPDVDDASQRQFRGLLVMLGIFVSGIFPAGVFALLAALHAAPVVSALGGAAVAAGITFLVVIICGNMYNNFNPTD